MLLIWCTSGQYVVCFAHPPTNQWKPMETNATSASRKYILQCTSPSNVFDLIATYKHAQKGNEHNLEPDNIGIITIRGCDDMIKLWCCRTIPHYTIETIAIRPHLKYWWPLPPPPLPQKQNSANRNNNNNNNNGFPEGVGAGGEHQSYANQWKPMHANGNQCKPLKPMQTNEKYKPMQTNANQCKSMQTNENQCNQCKPVHCIVLYGIALYCVILYRMVM